MILIHSFWLLFVAYYAILLAGEYGDNLSERFWTMNLIASISDLTILISDYIYLKVQFSASLTLPIVLNFYMDDKAYIEKKRRATLCETAFNVAFFSIVAGWFVMTVIKG